VSFKGLTLRHLCLTGSTKEPAAIDFSIGLNVIHGSSDTGKSFIFEMIDFRLGASAVLRDIPERVGYERVVLGIEDSQGGTFTLARSTAGGKYLGYEGLHKSVPTDTDGHTLSPKHNPNNAKNLSAFLLSKIGLPGKRVRKNEKGDTNSLSFRNLAPFCLVSEEDIQKKGSPIQSDNYVANTVEYSTFRMLLTGTDDSALPQSESEKKVDASRAAKLELINELIDEQKQRLTSLVGECMCWFKTAHICRNVQAGHLLPIF